MPLPTNREDADHRVVSTPTGKTLPLEEKVPSGTASPSSRTAGTSPQSLPTLAHIIIHGTPKSEPVKRPLESGCMMEKIWHYR